MIGDRLRELRKAYNKTQEELGAYLNLSNVAYGDYERNRSEPDISTLIKIADYYNVSLDYLFGREIKNIQIMNLKAETKSLSRDKLIEIVDKQIDLLLLIHQEKK